MLSPLRLPSRSTPPTPPPTPTLAQFTRPPASSYFRSMPQRASIRQITRTVTYASIARLSSDITSATRRMLSPSPPRGNTKENATVWSPAVAMPITPRKPLGPFAGVTLSGGARRTPDKGSQHATFAYGLPSPTSPPARRLRPSSVRLARLPIAPFVISSPPRRTSPASRMEGDYVATPPSSECTAPVSADHQAYPVTPTSSRGYQHILSSPRSPSPLSRKLSSIGVGNFKTQCDEEERLISAFRSVSFSSSSSLSFSGFDEGGLNSQSSSTVLQLYVTGRDVPVIFSTTSPLAKMIQQAREEYGPRKGKLRQPILGVQPVRDVPDLRVAQTTRAPEVEMQVAQVEQWTEALPGCMGTRGLGSVGAPRSDERASSESTSGHNTPSRGARPKRRPNGRMDRPQSTPPVSLRLSADSTSIPTGTGPKFMPVMRTRSILSRLTGKAKVASPPAPSLGAPGGATGGGSLVRSNTTGKRGASHPL
jgi:hypothetical protein